MLKANLLKFIDRYIGSFIGYLFPRPLTTARTEKLDSILFIRPGGIGDAVLLIPAIHALKREYPDVRIFVLAGKRNGKIFDLCQFVDQIYLYDNVSDLLKVMREKYDVVIDTEQWHRLSAVVARLTKARVFIGYGTNERARLFTFAVPYSHDEYEVDSFFNLLTVLGIKPTSGISKTFLAVPRSGKNNARESLDSLNNRRFVVIFAGASIPERRWGADKFHEVAKRLHIKGVPVIVIGGKEDVCDGERIVYGMNGINLAGKTSLVETAAVIEKAALLISGDSGILHIAVGLDRPTISLFGPGRVNKWAPRGSKHIVINKCLPCSPCTSFGYTSKCPIDAKCMADITVDDVMAAVDKLMINNGLGLSS